MTYTVKKLAKISGISSRTLRFYDEIGLFKPAYYGDNQYRYYKEEQLLILQQILFFRELGFPLNDIQTILSSDEFNKIEALKAHKSTLQSNLERTATLIKTIDKTISHLRGKLIMRDTELFEGFDPDKQQEHENYMINNGILSQEQIDESWQQAAHWKKADWEKFKAEGEQINRDFVEALKKQLQPDSAEVQQLVQRHFNWVKTFWLPTQESYLGLAQMYLDHSDFRDFFQRFDPKLVDFLVAAMQVFAKNNLS